MRIAVVDVGSNTVRLVVADADGQAPLPVHTSKRRLRLAEHVDGRGRLTGEPVARLVEAVSAAKAEAARWGVGEPFAFATAVVRDAPNRGELIEAVRAGSGLKLNVLPGEVEAELTFLAVRRWFGWRAGPLAVLDIGGGSLEVAFGRSRLPDFAVSLPLGAGRLTRKFLLDEDPPSPQALKSVRRYTRHQLRDAAARMRWEAPRTAVATSRTFQQLARLCGAAPGRHGPFVPRRMTRKALGKAVGKLEGRTAAERAELPGISAARVKQCLAGAVVAHTTMTLMGIEQVTISPWAIREGILLRSIEESGAARWPRSDHARGNGRPLRLPPLDLADLYGGSADGIRAAEPGSS